jgi:alkaline phosphatase D
MSPVSRRNMLRGMVCIASASSVAFLTGCSVKSKTDTKPNLPEDETASPQLANFDNLDDFDYPIIDALLPFAHGVASGDPMQDRVIIWTRITIPDDRGPLVSDPQGFLEAEVNWLVATDPELQNIIARGNTTTSAERDWTVKVDATGLDPATTYYYAFGAFQRTSIVGRTRTAPSADSANDELRLAVVSCASYWSSHWSGYQHIADRNDLDLVIHLGDYIYDFVDQDEEVRARIDRNGAVRNNIEDVDYRDWLNVDEVRRRYALYRSEPNLLRAHQQHPWTIIWDNHDIDPSFGNELNDSNIDRDSQTTTLDDTINTFWLWTPCRPPADMQGTPLMVDDGSYPEPPFPHQLWRKLDFGPLADILCTDIELYRQLSAEQLPADYSDHLDNGPSLLGKSQYSFITEQMKVSSEANKVWRVLPHQTWLAPWNIPSSTAQNTAPGSPITTRWSEFSEERDQWFEFLNDNNIVNNIVLSGDMHGSWASDLVASNVLDSSYQSSEPLPNTRSGSRFSNTLAGFSRAGTGNTAQLNNRADSVGVEFAPSSMGRGGADELVANALPGSSEEIQVAGARALELASITANKNVQFQEWVDHGYGVVHLTQDEAIFEFWWQDKITPNSPDILGFQMVSFAADEPTALPSPRFRNQIDNVVLHGREVEATTGSRTALPAPMPKGALIQN